MFMDYRTVVWDIRIDTLDHGGHNKRQPRRNESWPGRNESHS
jgi:hypothetical protein